MKKQTVFIKRYISSGERPEKSGIYMTDAGFNQYRNERFDLDPKWWLEEKELPSEGEIEQEEYNNFIQSERNYYFKYGFKTGANFILNKIK